MEGPTAAGPIGGTDIRSAMLPPPGLYGGTIQLAAGTLDFVDGKGHTIPALRDAHLAKQVGGPFLFYVPDISVLGGSIGFGGIIPAGNQCGHLFVDQSDRCTLSIGDPYVELDWSRSFAKARPSKFPGAYPILEGLTILVGFGMVIPAGQFDDSNPLEQALTMGTNVWDFAPTVAFTYTTPPILAEGTEVSVKLYRNYYLENPATHYLTGDLVNVDFAVTERIGRFQVGVAGFYALQIEDDKLRGIPVAPDGLRVEMLQLGGVVNYDMPEYATSLRVKALTTVATENTVESWGVVFGWLKAF